ncbi:MAG TPA: hypothetical protein VL360_08625 [Gammaproteobacteria bacterium]|nr:hypothetical protein [Gammaproteobacteria bacterium]
MVIWEELTEEELYFILECDKLKYIVAVFNSSNRQKKITHDKWLQAARSQYQFEPDKGIIGQSIFNSLNEAPSYSFMTLLSIIGMAALKIFALSFLTAGFSALMLFTGGIYFASSYKAQKDKEDKDRKFFDLASIKLQCADEIIRRHELSLKFRPLNEGCDLYLSDDVRKLVIKPFEYKNKDKFDKFKSSLGAGLLSFTMLFGTYYLGACTLIAAFGLATTIALGPIGIGIALGVAAIIGGYCGYLQYKSDVLAEKIDKKQKKLMNYFNYKRHTCYHLQKQLDHHDIPRNLSEPDFLHKRTLSNTDSNTRDFLMRREIILRQHRAHKEGKQNAISRSIENNNNLQKRLSR